MFRPLTLNLYNFELYRFNVGMFFLRQSVYICVFQVNPAITELILTFDLLRNFLFDSDEVKVLTKACSISSYQ